MSLSSGLSVAVPKYLNPIACAAVLSLVVEVPVGSAAAAVAVAKTALFVTEAKARSMIAVVEDDRVILGTDDRWNLEEVVIYHLI